MARWYGGAAAGLDWRDLTSMAKSEFRSMRFEFVVFDDDNRDVSSNRLPDIAWAAPGVIAICARLSDWSGWLDRGHCRIAPIFVKARHVYDLVLPETVAANLDLAQSGFARFRSSGRIKKVDDWVLKPVTAPPLPPPCFE